MFRASPLFAAPVVFALGACAGTPPPPEAAAEWPAAAVTLRLEAEGARAELRGALGADREATGWRELEAEGRRVDRGLEALAEFAGVAATTLSAGARGRDGVEPLALAFVELWNTMEEEGLGLAAWSLEDAARLRDRVRDATATWKALDRAAPALEAWGVVVAEHVRRLPELAERAEAADARLVAAETDLRTRLTEVEEAYDEALAALRAEAAHGPPAPAAPTRAAALAERRDALTADLAALEAERARRRTAVARYAHRSSLLANAVRAWTEAAAELAAAWGEGRPLPDLVELDLALARLADADE